MSPDTIGCMRELLKMYSKSTKADLLSESAIESDNFVKSAENIKNNICISREELPDYVPMLTPKEIKDFDLPMDNNEETWYDDYRRTYMIGTSNDDYICKLRTACHEYGKDPSGGNAAKLINMGWVPGVEPTSEVFAANKDHLYEYMLEHMVRVIDLTDVTQNLEEATSSTDGIIAKVESGLLRPVYLVCVYTYSTFGKLIVKATSSKYSHAAIGFDPKLEKLYSYNMSNGEKGGGLSFESIGGYIKDNPGAKLHVQVIFLTKRQYEKMKGNIDYYIGNFKNSHYSVGNVFNILVGRAKKTTHDLSMVCSQFVDSMLKLINVDITNKPSNLVIPEDIVDVNNPTVYKVYEGEAKDYNWKKIQAMVNKLTKNAEAVRSSVYETACSMYTDEVVLEIYKVIGEMLTAKPVFKEVAIPVEIDDNGDLSIETYKNYETKYREIHTLLKALKDNESIETELCKLWYINCKIEAKIQKGRGKNKDLEPYYKLRSRVLNDFNKYMKKIYETEPEFSFSEYYKNSDYYDGKIKVKRSTLKGVGKFVQDIINFT